MSIHLGRSSVHAATTGPLIQYYHHSRPHRSHGSTAFGRIIVPRGGSSEQDDKEEDSTTTTLEEIPSKESEEEIPKVEEEDKAVDDSSDKNNNNNNKLSSSSSLPIFQTWSDQVQQPLDFSDLVFGVVKTTEPTDDNDANIPMRYLVAHKQQREKAQQAYEATCQWREENHVDSILQRPHVAFDICRKIFPISLPGRDPNGHLIIIQRPGMIDMNMLHTHHNLQMQDLLWHYIYMVEYCWNLLDPSDYAPTTTADDDTTPTTTTTTTTTDPQQESTTAAATSHSGGNGVMTTVLDCQGVNMSCLKNAEYRQFLQLFVKTMSDHYPTRSYKTIIINAPSWIRMVYNLVKPLLRESTKAKITICSKSSPAAQNDILLELLGATNCQGLLITTKDDDSKNDDETPPSPLEEEMRLLCTLMNQRAGVEMLAV